MYARMDSTSGPLFTVFYYTETAKFSTCTVEGMAWRRARRSGGWLEVYWSVAGSGWLICTARRVWLCAVWLSGIRVRGVACADLP